jgi:hypothetical protein
LRLGRSGHEPFDESGGGDAEMSDILEQGGKLQREQEAMTLKAPGCKVAHRTIQPGRGVRIKAARKTTVPVT